VTVPALPGCITQGETTDECIANAQEAIALYLEGVVASGDPIPEERERLSYFRSQSLCSAQPGH
jgi:antitoxin HicB